MNLTFPKMLKQNGVDGIRRQKLEILQVNVGKLCNQACHHCHVEAGPKRTEIMTKKTVDRILSLLDKDIHTVDLTGGAPEMMPHFRYFVRELRNLNKTVINRCNLTIFFEKGYSDIPEFLKDQKVHIIASLPCYQKENVEAQRGRGVFGKSIEALKMLNQLGYGSEGSSLKLDLVYNPVEAHLPPDQKTLQDKYKLELMELFEIQFNELYTIVNMPIKRYADHLHRLGQWDEYMTLLRESFNPHVVNELMCRNQLSIGWDGQVYDCDFNQMLELPVIDENKTIWKIESFQEFTNNAVHLAEHCYGCTAGSGSSCAGSLT